MKNTPFIFETNKLHNSTEINIILLWMVSLFML